MSSLSFSKRTPFVHENVYAQGLKSQEIKYDLTSSNPTRVGFSALSMHALLEGVFDQAYLADSLGSVKARQLINDHFYPNSKSVDDLCLTASTSEAYGLIFKILCDHGDEILVPRPSYPLFEALADLDGVHLKAYGLYHDGDDWWIDFHTLIQSISPRTKAIIIVNPNNPTGHYLKPSEFKQLEDLGIPLIVDEVFKGFDLNGFSGEMIDFQSSSLPCFVLNGLSKWAGLPFVKVGWIKVSGQLGWQKEAIERLAWANDAYLSLNGLSSFAVERGLLSHCEVRRNEILSRIRENDLLLNRLLLNQNQHLVKRNQQSAGWMSILSLPLLHDDETWCLLLLENLGVLVQPGYFYDFEQSARVVISLITPTALLEAGMIHLIDFIEKEMEKHCHA
jgi:aspartate/methionine/tyrosine aminotransferase